VLGRARELVNISHMGKHRNKTQSRMFVVNFTVLYIIPGVESVFWKHIFYKYVRLYIGCGNLTVSVDQQHNLQRLTQNKTGSVLTTMALWYNCVTIVDVQKQYFVSTLCVHSLI
jgi:hypothetical protein